MDKFCTNCGKSLPESGACDCQETIAAVEDTAAPVESATCSETAAPAAENTYVKQTKQATRQLAPFIKQYFANPAAATLTALREQSIALAVILMVLSAAVSGLLLCATFGKTMASVREIVREIGGVRIDVQVPFFSSFFAGFAITLILLALSVLALYVFLKVMRVNASLRYSLICVGVNTVLFTALGTLAWLCVLVGLGWVAMVALGLGVVLWAVLGVVLAIKVFGAQLTGVTTLLFTALFALVLCLGLWIGSKLVVRAAGNITVENMKISDAIEEISDRLDDLDRDEFAAQIQRGLAQLVEGTMYESMDF